MPKEIIKKPQLLSGVRPYPQWWKSVALNTAPISLSYVYIYLLLHVSKEFYFWLENLLHTLLTLVCYWLLKDFFWVTLNINIFVTGFPLVTVIPLLLPTITNVTDYFKVFNNCLSCCLKLHHPVCLIFMIKIINCFKFGASWLFWKLNVK